MPKTAIDYSKTIIYKIVCNDLTIPDLYVGHTTDFTRRKRHHKGNSSGDWKKCDSNLKIYKKIRENGGWDNWSMIQIEEFPCANSNEACARERYFYEQLNATLNMKLPHTTKEEKVEYRHQHYVLNREKTLEQCKRYNELNKDKRKQNYELNKGKFNALRAHPYTCECGSICRVGDKSRHFKSLKHQAFITQKDNEEIKI